METEKGVLLRSIEKAKRFIEKKERNKYDEDHKEATEALKTGVVEFKKIFGIPIESFYVEDTSNGGTPVIRTKTVDGEIVLKDTYSRCRPVIRTKNLLIKPRIMVTGLFITETKFRLMAIRCNNCSDYIYIDCGMDDVFFCDEISFDDEISLGNALIKVMQEYRTCPKCGAKIEMGGE